MRQRQLAILLAAAMTLVGCATGPARGPAVSAWTAPPEPGLEWVRSRSGWQIPDATGLRLFKPSVSGGTGVRF